MTQRAPLRTLLVLAVLALSLGACHRRVVRTVSVSGQPVATQGSARPATISHRHYRHLQRQAARDMRCGAGNLLIQEASPGIFSIQGCGLLREYVMVCGHRRRCTWVPIQPVEQVALAETRCQTGMIGVAATSGLTRQVTACGQTLDYALACGPGGCGWVRGVAPSAVAMQTEPGTTVVVVADDPALATAPIPPPPPAPPMTSAPPPVEEQQADEPVDLGAAAGLQGVFATQLAAIRACTGGQQVTVQVAWDNQGVVTVTLMPPFGGTAVEQCVRQAIGPMQFQAGAAGAVQATL